MDNKKQNPTLSEVIGSLVSSVAHARSVADAEALRIAHRYHQHELLKGLPIPRLRIRKVSISLPVILTELEEGKAAVSNNPADIAKSVAEALRSALETMGSRLDRLCQQESATSEEKKERSTFKQLWALSRRERVIGHFQSSLVDQLAQRFDDLARTEGGDGPADALFMDAAADAAESVFRDDMQELIYRYVEELVRGESLARWYEEVLKNDTDTDAAEAPEEVFDPERARAAAKRILNHAMFDDLVQAVRHAAQANALVSHTKPPDLYVAVDTDSIKNSGGGPATVTRLDMVLHEEGLEWLTEEQGGVESTRLLPE